MVAPETQTSVEIRFENTDIITGNLYDYRNHVDIELSIPNSADRKKVVYALAIIGYKTETNANITKTIRIKKNNTTSIGTPTSVSAKDQVYKDKYGNSFQNLTAYSIRIVVGIQEEGGINTAYNGTFKVAGNEGPSYEYLHREDGGDRFDTTQLGITNANRIESGSDIEVKCPLLFAASQDNRKPTLMSFHFEEHDNYDGDANDTDNMESIAAYFSVQAYSGGGLYTLVNNELENDTCYLLTVTAIYSDGYTISDTIPNLNVIAAPQISAIVAYGLGEDKSDSGDPLTSSVMNVYINQLTNPKKIIPASGNVTFKLSQNGVLFYSAIVPVSDNKQRDGTYLYTILRSDLLQRWTTTHPYQQEDKSYTYGVTMVIEYSTSSGTVEKTSEIVSKNFNNDVNQVHTVYIFNAWVGATDVDGEGDRVVNYSNATTAQGYNVAPGFGIIGTFNKDDSFKGGGGTSHGFLKDLDSTETKFEIMLKVNEGPYQLVKKLYMIQGGDTISDQQRIIDLLSLSPSAVLSSDYGVYDNIPGDLGVPGSEQPPIHFWIPDDELTRLGASQSDGIIVSVALQPAVGETTRPAATESNEVALLCKVNRYDRYHPEYGSELEPSFSNGTLYIPIRNEKTSTGDLHLDSSEVTINSYTVPITVSQHATEDGIYDHTIDDPGNRGNEAFRYQVAYKISDPNGGTITGPKSEEYAIYLKDEPTKNNFTVSNYEYNVFNNHGESSFKFDIEFSDVDTTGIDGVLVYFQRNGDSSETIVEKVERSGGESQSITVTLATTSAESSSVSHGIYIPDIDGTLSTSMWGNFDSGNVIFKPYQTPKVESSDDTPVVIHDPQTKVIMNIPVIDMPTNVSLTGGVIESYHETYISWDNDLEKYHRDGESSIEVSFYLEENSQNVTEHIVSPLDDSPSSYFDIDLGNAPSTYTMNLSTKVVADGKEFYSKSVVLEFDSVSVDQSGMTVTVRRGSNDVFLKAEYVDYRSNPEHASFLNVTAVQLIDNPNEDENPYNEDINVLDYSDNEVQPHATINTNSIPPGKYRLGHELMLTMRIKAGVDYSLTYGDLATSDEESTPQFLTLNGPSKSYIVVKKPTITIDGSSSVVSSGPYNGQTKIPVTLNANGLNVEGLLSVVFVLVKENDYTDENDAADGGAEIVLAFESSNGRLRSYTTQPAADITTGSSDNLGATEKHVLTVDHVDGFSGTASSNDFTLVCGTLDQNDRSALYLPSECEFAGDVTLNVVAFMSTRLGTDVDMRVVTESKYPVVRDDNGKTYKFVGTIPENATNPFIVEGVNNQYYAVMKDTGQYDYYNPNDSVVLISNYASGNNTNLFRDNDGALIPFERIVTTLMTSFQAIFFYVDNFNSDITTWDTSNVTTFADAFQASTNGGIFNQDIRYWDTSKVTNMNNFLRNQGHFNQDISDWNVNNVTSFYLEIQNYSKLPPKFRLDPMLNTFPDMNNTVGGANFNLTAPITYSLGTFSYTSSNESVATISGSTVTIVGLGSTTITAIQAYDDNHRSASISATLTVGKATPDLSNFPNMIKTTLDDAQFTINQPNTLSSGSFSYSSSDESIATILGNTVTIFGTGTVTITATQAATDNYESGSIRATLTINSS
jgi:hypothetical protein